MDEPEPAFKNPQGPCGNEPVSLPMVIEGQGRVFKRELANLQPGAAALLAGAHAYRANAKRLVRRLPAGSMRALSA